MDKAKKKRALERELKRLENLIEHTKFRLEELERSKKQLEKRIK